MVTMVERVARAICWASGYDPDGRDEDTLPENESIDGWLNCYGFKPEARAAINAVREPTHRMTVAGHTALDETEHTQTKALGHLMGRMAFVDVWQAMIDAALKE